MIILLLAIVIIIGLFGFASKQLLQHKKTADQIIDIFNSGLMQLKFDSINEDHHMVSEKFLSHSHNMISNIWREFEESLVVHDDSIENTLDAEHFFNEQSIASGIFNNEFLKNVPNILVGIGVVFTFIGLVLGLGGLDINSENVDALKKGIEAIINGASISFWSSICGILFSIILNVASSQIKTDLLKKIKTLQNNIDFKYPRTNPEKSLAEMRVSAKETEFHLASLSETLGDKIQESIRGIGQEIGMSIEDSLTNSIKPFMEDISQKAMNSSETAFDTIMDEFLKKVGDAGENQQKLILETNKVLQDSLVEFKKEFVAQVSDLGQVIEKLNNSYHILEDRVVDQFDVVVSKLADVVDDHGKTTEKLVEQADSLNRVIESLENVSEGFETSMENLNIVLKDNEMQAENHRQIFMSTINSLNDLYNSNMDVNLKLSEASRLMAEPFKQLSAEYDRMRDNVEESVESMSKKMNDVLNNYFTEVQNQTNERMREWNNQTSTFSSAMLDVTNELNTIISQIREENRS